jgi:hypothetical protein
MAKNLAGKTYEVLTADGNRWIFHSTFDMRSSALEHAEELLGLDSHDGVQVTSESERTGELEVILRNVRTGIRSSPWSPSKNLPCATS